MSRVIVHNENSTHLCQKCFFYEAPKTNVIDNLHKIMNSVMPRMKTWVVFKEFYQHFSYQVNRQLFGTS